ncbi:hypothetical protein [Sphingomonas quercus]|uniref:Uncharacterized protein n=1 Tax=Sphingomonas quercus TaxID=2842451 RepID=A0ABS6BDG2_9SPHN|nr:hypothetical protein [Sphingomonas quercus]MBU3076352.1 hypothetical protein [Sphingomonas quercus]
MYELIDQPVNAIGPGSRLLLWAMRGWAQARASGTCPPGAIAPAFLHCGVIAALPDLHRLMLLLEGGELERLMLPPPGAPRIDDIEAVLLQLWADALSRPHCARATLSLMLCRESGGTDRAELDAAFTALGKVATVLLGKGLAPEGLAARSSAGT